MEAKEILTTDEAGEFLSLTPYTVREYAKKGIIPARKVGKSWRFVKADLLAWLRGKDEGNPEEK
jgi:excisionase family DNA binding protein